MAVPEGAVEGDDTPPVPDVVGAAPAGLPDAGMVLCCGCGNCDSCPPEARCGGVCWNLNHPLRVTGSWFASAVNPVSLPYVPGGGWWEYAAAFGPAPVTPCFCAADGNTYGYASGTAGTVLARVACLTVDSFGLRYSADVIDYGGGCCFRYVVRFWAPSGPSFVPFSCAVCGALQYEGLERAVGINAVFTRSGPAFAGPYSLLTRTLGRTSSGGQACFFGWGPSTGGPTDSPPAGYYYAFSTGSGFGQRWYFLPTDAGTDGVCSAEDITLKINGAWDQPNTEVTTTGTATVTLESTPCGPIDPPAPPPGDGEGERPAMLAARAVESPVCRHRSDDPLPSAGVAAAGLNPRIDWFRCERPGFERFGLPVTACRTCNTPADRRCGPLSGCPGYEPPDPD